MAWWTRALALRGQDTTPTTRREPSPDGVPDEWAEVERLHNVIKAALETVDEMTGQAKMLPGLTDDLLDLRKILMEGEAHAVRRPGR
jgi:hypothetical protein